ncbi:MAG: biopolymer transporter ExbD [Gemmatimonadetes bacterium]|nr:biopolymer transporter ExbD [Gemmatimonadota bacterium]
MAKRSLSEEEQGLNLTPLIDCVFLLLIFFMVTTVFKQPYTLQVQLPEAAKASQIEEKKLVGTVTIDGRIEINRNLVTSGELETVLLREKQDTGSLTLILRTDQQTRHKHMLEMLEVAKRVGVEKIVLATDDQQVEIAKE